jgi:hypothetical protein
MLDVSTAIANLHPTVRVHEEQVAFRIHGLLKGKVDAQAANPR